MNNQEITLVFDAPNIHFDPKELADFIFLFNAVYVAATKYIRIKELEIFLNKKEDNISSFFSRINELSILEINELFTTDLKERRLLFTRISKKNPLEIDLLGLLIPLTVAVIISGGELSFFPPSVVSTIKCRI